MFNPKPNTENSLASRLRTEQLFDEQRQAIIRYTDRLLAELATTRERITGLGTVFAKQVQLLGHAKAGQVDARAIAEVEQARADSALLSDEVPRAIEQTLDGVDRVARIVRAMKEFSHSDGASKADVDLPMEAELHDDCVLAPLPQPDGDLNQTILLTAATRRGP